MLYICVCACVNLLCRVIPKSSAGQNSWSDNRYNNCIKDFSNRLSLKNKGRRCKTTTFQSDCLLVNELSIDRPWCSFRPSKWFGIPKQRQHPVHVGKYHTHAWLDLTKYWNKQSRRMLNKKNSKRKTEDGRQDRREKNAKAHRWRKSPETKIHKSYVYVSVHVMRQKHGYISVDQKIL